MVYVIITRSIIMSNGFQPKISISKKGKKNQKFQFDQVTFFLISFSYINSYKKKIPLKNVSLKEDYKYNPLI